MDRTILIKHSDALERRASMLSYYAKSRVSHTAAGLIRCILSIADMVPQLQSKANFTKMITNAFTSSRDAAGGSYEVIPYEDGTIWIEGSFHIDELRKYLITIPQSSVLNLRDERSGVQDG